MRRTSHAISTLLTLTIAAFTGFFASAQANSEPETAAPSAFGLHVHYPTATNRYVWPAPYVGFGSYRVWDNAEGVLWPYIQRNAPQPIVAIIRNKNTVTVTTAGPHQIYKDSVSTVKISGVWDASFNGTFEVSSVRSATSFKYSQQGSDASSTGGVADDYDWTNLDRLLRQTSSDGKEVLFTLGPTPIWAVARVPEALSIAEAVRAPGSELVTVTTPAPHGITLNRAAPQTVWLAGVQRVAGSHDFDGAGKIIDVPDEVTFQLRSSGTFGDLRTGDLGTGGTARIYDWGAAALLAPHEQPAAPATSMEPDLEAWSNFITQLVKRYCGCDSDSHPTLRLKQYEVWNEPDLFGGSTGASGSVFFAPAAGRSIDMSATAQVRLAQSAYSATKAVDPLAVVISPSATGVSSGLPWLRAFLQKGGGTFFDVLGYHFYHEGPPENVRELIDAVLGVLSESGVSAPVWDTEAGWGARHTVAYYPDEPAQAAWVARAYILRFAQGIDRVYWYDWSDQCWTYVRLTIGNRRTMNYADYPQGCGSHTDLKGVSAAGTAYGEVYKWLVGATAPDCASSTEGTWVCTLRRVGGYEGRILWNTNGQYLTTVPPDWNVAQIRKMDGAIGTLASDRRLVISEQPMLLENQAAF